MRVTSLGPPRHISRCQAIGWSVGVCVLALTPQLAAPQGPWSESTANSPRTTTVVGVIGDSLHGGPLAGAVVMLDGSTREAVTDSIGRFRIDNVQSGHYRVGIFHPILDSLGTSLASRPVQLTGGRPMLVSLATPSGRTLRHAICPTLHATARLAERRDSGVAVLVGRVLDPESETPVPGAQLKLTWIETLFGPQPTQIVPYERATETDATGEFRFCGLPAGLNFVLQAVDSADHISVERELGLQNRIITMTTLHLATADDSTHAASLTGEVERPDGEPLAGATATVEGTGDSVTSDTTGTFVMRRVPTGTHMVVVHAMGFEPVTEPVELSSHTPQHVTVAMTTPAYELSPVVVEAQQLQAGYARVGFSRRRQQGIGQFLTADQIAARHADMFSQIVRVPTAITADGPATGNNLRRSPGADACVEYVLNGQPFNRVAPNEVDATVKPAEVGGVEIYAPLDVPPEFHGQPAPTGTRTAASAAECTTVVVWTKAELGVR